MRGASSSIRLPGFNVHIQADDLDFVRHLARLFDLSPAVSPSDSPIIYEAVRQENQWTVSYRHEPLYHGTDLDAAIVALYGHLYEWFVPRSKHFLVHAGIASYQDDAIALVGAQESGKSTLTAVFVANGWQSLSDDVGALDADSQRVFPYPRHFLLRPETFCRNPCVENSFEILHQLDAYGELVFVSRPKQRIPRTAARLSMIVFPQWSQERTHIERLSPGAASVRLMDNSLNLRFLGYRGVRMATTIARECPSFCLSVKDPLDAVSLVHSIHTA